MISLRNNKAYCWKFYSGTFEILRERYFVRITLYFRGFNSFSSICTFVYASTDFSHLGLGFCYYFNSKAESEKCFCMLNYAPRMRSAPKHLDQIGSSRSITIFELRMKIMVLQEIDGTRK